MADGQEPQGTPTPSDANKAAAGSGKDGAASEAFRLDSGNAPGRDDAAERARDYGSLDILQGESDPANPNLHTGTRQPVDPGTYQQNLGAPADSGAVDGTTPGAGLSGIAASGNSAEQSFVPSAPGAPASVNATPGASAALNDTTLDATLDTGISTLQALTDRIARLAAGDDDTTNPPAPATAQDATAQRTGTNPSLTPEPTEETINRPPTDILLDNAGVVENAAPGTVVAVLSAIDPDSGEVFTYEIAGGSDLFEIVGNAVLVKEGADLDHETLASVDLQLVVRDSAGNTYFETVTLEIRDVNEVATDIALDGSTIAENASGATVGTLSTTDQDNGDTHTYAVSDDRFEVVDGQLKLKDGVALDHEAEDTVSIDVTTTDAGGLDYTETFTVTVADINEAPIDIELTGDTVVSTQNAAVTNENISTGNGGGAGTSVVTLPSDTGAAITIDFARIDNSFELVVNGQSLTGNTIQLQSNVYDPGTQSFLQFADGSPISRPWVPTEDGGPRIQAVISENGVEFFATRSPSSSVLEPLELVNGSITAPDLIEGANTVTIINPDDHGPDGIEAVLSASFQDSALGVDENEAGAVVGTLQTTDPDEGDTHTYAVSDDRFEVVDGQLKLKDGVALDHEAEPSLAIDVTTTDAGGLSRTETFNIAVGDINEVVTDIALDNTTIAENAPGAIVGTLSVVDPDEGDTHTYAVSDDRFEVVDGQLKLKDGVALDHEAEEAISVDVTATDAGGLARTETFDIAVSDVNEVPNDITLTPAPHFGDTAELTVRLGGEAFRGDPNYQILVDGQVVGEGTVSWARDTETDGTYTTLGGNGDVDNDQVVWQNVSINVPVPEGGLGLVEVRFPNDAYRAGVGDRNLIVDYIEVDGHRIEAESSDVNYQGAGGSYDSSLGAERMPWGGTLQFDTTSIFEGATFGGDPVAVDQPMVMENSPGAVVGTLTTSDPDAGDTHTYAVSDDRFEVVDGQLKLKDGVALDHETADSISIEVTATDAGGLARTETFDIAVRDVNEAPNDIGMVVNTENLLVNGSFEEGTLATGRWTIDDAETVTPGWQSDGNVELWDNLFGRAAAEGDQHIELDSDRGVNSIFQDVSTNPGQVYELDMSVMSRTGRSETVEVFWNGEKVGSFSTDQTSWQDAGLKVVGTGDTDRLEFREPAGDNDSYGGLIDDVSLRAVPFEIGENAAGAVIATLSVVDPDAGDSHTYAVSDDRFEVVSGQLKLKDGISLNHEDAATVSIDVSVTDQGGLSHTENLTLSVLDVNEGPTDIVLDGTPVVENDAGAVVGTISVVDPDAGDTHTYTVSDDRFEVVDGQLKLKDGVALDHETADSISVDVTATDAGGLARTESFDIAVGDANEVATDIGLDGTTVAENDAGAVVGTISVVDPDAGDTHKYTVSDDRFEVVDGELKLKDGVALDHETADSISVDVTATDAGGLARTESFDIAVGDANEVATDIALDGTSVAENDTGAVVGTVSVVDPDAGDTHTYTVSDDRFEVVDGQLKLKDGVALDHETADSISVDVTATDAGGLARTESFDIAVGDANEVATDIALDGTTVAENDAGAVVGTISVVDPDAGDTHTYTVSDDRFEVVDGQLKLKDGVALDHESADTISVDVTATDAGGLARTESFDIAVGDANEVATDIALDGASVAENDTGAVVGTVSVVDPDAGDTHTYTVSDDRFEIVDGELKLKDGVALDHETADSISVDVTATDAGGLARTESFDISVADANEAPVSITLSNADYVAADFTGQDGDRSKDSISERGLETDSAVVTISFTTSDDVSGAQTLFETGGRGTGLNIVIEDGQLNVYAGSGNDLELSVPIEGGTSYNMALELDKGSDTLKLLLSDELAPGDMTEDNSLVASQSDWTDRDWDGGDGLGVGTYHGSTQGNTGGDFQGTIDGPGVRVFADADLESIRAESSADAVSENDAGATIGNLSTSDPDAGDTHTYTVSDDRFEVVDGQLKLKDGMSLDHETTDSVTIEVTTTDAGGLTHTQSFDIAVNDANEVATDISLDGSAIAENDAGAVVGTISVVDPDAGDTHTYTVSDDRFEVVDGELKLKDGVSLDSADGNVTVEVTATDAGGLARTESFDVTVNDINQVATDISLDATTVSENDAGAVVGNLSVVDPDAGDTHTYAVSDDRFEVVDGQLKLKDGVALDHETADSISVDVTATDAGGLARTESFDIAVGDANEVATDIALDGASVAENDTGAVVGTVSVVDPDAGDTHTYTVSDDRFEVVDGQLKLKDGVALDHETADSISVNVTATDAGGLARTESFDIAVGDANEVATDIALDGTTVAEYDAGAVVGTISVVDPDAGDTHTYTVSDDRFEVVDGQLKLKDGVALDHESADSISVDVTATDAGGLARTESFDIAVGDANEVATDIALVGASVAENDAGAVVGTVSVVDPDAGDTHTYTVSDDRFEVVDGQLKLKDGVALDHETADSISVDVTATDAGGLARTESFDIAVGDVDEVASAPDLSLGSTSRVIFSEDFEGWSGTVVDEGGDHLAAQNGWSSDGVAEIRDTGADGNGSEAGSVHHAELNNDPTDSYDDAPNLARTVDTVDEGSYTITFDFAPRPGYDASVNVMEVVWDGEVVATISADGTNDTDLNWQSHTLTVSGDGNPAEIEFREAGVDTDYGRGMMIDNIEMVETLDGAASGVEGGTIVLPDISATLTDTDGSESLAVSISAIPEGAVLSDGTNTFTATSGDTDVDVSDWNLDSMTITTPDNFTGTVDLQVTATSTESEGGATSSTTSTLQVHVANVEEAATDMALDNTSVAENDAGAVIGNLSVTDADAGDTHTYTVSDDRFEVVDGALKLKDGVSLDHEAADTVSVDVTATDSAGLAYTESFSVSVSDVNETQTLWSENFNGLSNGTQSDTGSTAWSVDESQTSLGSSAEHGVDNGAYEFGKTTGSSGDDESVAVWRSEQIDISGKTGLTLSFDLAETGDMEESGGWHDFFKAYAVVDGERTELMVQDGDAGMSGTQTFTLTNIPEGDKVTIEFEAKTTDSSETFRLDNVELTSSGDNGATPLGDAGTPDGWTPENVIYANDDDKAKGGDSDDLLVGSSVDNKLEGKDGDDELRGGGGDDELKGGDGNDTLFGGADDDKLKGDDGNDYLDGGSGNDELDGGKGNDVLRGGAGNDKMEGKDGDDTFIFGSGGGSDKADGGGGSWTDIIRLENDDGTSISGDDWTLTLDEGSIIDKGGDSIELSDGAQGIITLSDGSEISFEGIERIEW